MNLRKIGALLLTTCTVGMLPLGAAAAECAAHTFTETKNGNLITCVCKNCGYAFKKTGFTGVKNGVYTKTVGNVRVSVLSETLIRIEESGSAVFNDAKTLMAPGRGEFPGAAVAAGEDADTVVLQTEKIIINLPKVNASAKNVRIFDYNGNLLYGDGNTSINGLYASLPFPAQTPSAWVLADNGILLAEGGLTYTGSTDKESGWARAGETDLYVFLPQGDAALLRADFVRLTGRAPLSPIKTLGSWYSKWTNYSAQQKLAMIERYRTDDVPLDIVVIDTEWKNTSVGGNGGNGTGYDVNTELYPDMEKFLADAEKAGVLILFNDHTHKTERTLTTPEELKWQTAGVLSLIEKGLDGWWYDRNWTYSIRSPFPDVLFSTLGEVFYYDTLHAYAENTAKDGEEAKRVLLLSNADFIKHGHVNGEPSVIGHRYGIQWTGDIFGDTLSLKAEIQNMVNAGAIGGSPYLSADLGGHRNNDTVSANAFARWVQYGAFSPVFRIHSTLSAKNEQFPWSYGAETEKVVRDYLKMRYQLLPYYYSLAHETYETGLPLARRLDFDYPAYAASADDTQYLLGRDLLVAPFWSTCGDGQEVVPAAWLHTETGENGLFAAYYNNKKSVASDEHFTGNAAYTAIVPDVNFFWNTGSPKSSVDADYFSARYTGTITPDVDCVIGTLADDGARIYIDGNLYATAWSSGVIRPAMNTLTPLKAGTTYKITVEYFEVTGVAQLFLVYSPVLEKNTSARSVFIPDGVWADVSTGAGYAGPQTITATGDRTYMPLYVRVGAILPAVKPVSPMQGADFQELSLNVYGSGNGSFTLYEDDGESEAYRKGGFRKTEITHEKCSETLEKICFAAPVGDFTTAYTTRTVTLRLHSSVPVLSVVADGKTVPVNKIPCDKTAKPFGESGAAPDADVYEAVFTLPISGAHTVLITTEPAPSRKTVCMTVGSKTCTVNGVAYAMDAAPIIRDNRTMLPVRYIAEALGAAVTWDGETSTATVTGDGAAVEITVGASTAKINGKTVPTDAAAFIENGRTYLPLRFMAEALGAAVTWDGETSSAVITK